MKDAVNLLHPSMTLAGRTRGPFHPFGRDVQVSYWELAQPGFSRQALTPGKRQRGGSLPSTATGDVQVALASHPCQHAPKRVFAQRVDVNRCGVGRRAPQCGSVGAIFVGASRP